MNKEHDNKGFMSVYTLIREKGLEIKSSFVNSDVDYRLFQE